MSDEKTILVNPSVASVQWGAGFRVAVIAVGVFASAVGLAAKGDLVGLLTLAQSPDALIAVGGVGATVAAVWGQIRTRKVAKAAIVMEEFAPNHIAKLKS